MNRAASAPSRPLLAFVLLLAVGGLSALIYGVAGDRSGMSLLADTGARIEVLPDPAHHFAWPAVRDELGWHAFQSRDYIHAGLGEAVWVRITLANPTAQPIRGVLADPDFIADEIQLWAPEATAPDGWSHARTGQSVPAAEKPTWGRAAAFPVELPPHSAGTLYLRAADHFSTWLQLQWWPEQRAFHAAQLRATLADALYFGILAALLIYNSVLWSRLRHRDLGYYLAYLGSFAFFMVLARAQDQVVGAAVPTPIYETLVAGSLAASAFFFVGFAREFLQFAELAPRFDRLARALLWLNAGLGLGALSILGNASPAWMHVVLAVGVATHGTIMAGAIIVWRAGAAHARYFALSFGALLLGGLPMAVQWLLAIPFGNAFLGALFGSALEMLLLSLALADRFARLQREHYEARLAEETVRLEALRYQLNPHFLFNALNSIYGLVLPHSAAAGDLVRRLSDFCRSTLMRPRGSWQTLADELAMLRSYLDIEQARWRENLVIATDFDPAADAFQIPPFLLLPLVENAIKHGGATSPRVLTLRLATRREPDGGLTLTVINSGEWQPEDSPPRASAAPFRASTGTGLANLRERLTRAYGPAATLTTAADDGWVTLTLRLPSPLHS
ncbi:MAG: histidine kinase [Candidatus Didemnitutus sp.]|nr:histidine kinase [Candidatus Didemnitutus sp.]